MRLLSLNFANQYIRNVFCWLLEYYSWTFYAESWLLFFLELIDREGFWIMHKPIIVQVVQAECAKVVVFRAGIPVWHRNDIASSTPVGHSNNNQVVAIEESIVRSSNSSRKFFVSRLIWCVRLFQVSREANCCWVLVSSVFNLPRWAEILRLISMVSDRAAIASTVTRMPITILCRIKFIQN